MQRSMADLEDNLDEAEKAFESQYEKVEPSLLGEGTYGKVFKAKSIRTGELVAMKQMKIEGSEDGMPSTASRDCFAQGAKGSPEYCQIDQYFLQAQQAGPGL